MTMTMNEAAEQLAELGYKIHGVREDSGLVLASSYGRASVWCWDGQELREMNHEQALEWAIRRETR